MNLRKYNTSATIYFDLFQLDGVDFEPAATFEVGDIKIMVDEGVEVNATNLPTDEGQGYSLVLTAAELSGARVKVYIVDQTATKTWLDTSVVVETYGNALASHAFDLDLASNNFNPTTDTVANVTLVGTTTTNTDMRGTDGALTDKAGFSLSATGLDAIASTATGMVEAAKAVWDRVLSGGTHNITNSAGRRLRQVDAAFILHIGTAQSATKNTITFDAGASSLDDFYNHTRVVIEENTGVEQERIVVDYNGATKVATVAPPWVTIPDATSIFAVEPALSHAETNSKTVKVGLAQSATLSTITLSADASSMDDYYNDDVVEIDFGTGEGQARIIVDYNGTTKVASISPDWIVSPDATSEYLIEEALTVVGKIENDVITAASIATDGVQDIQAGLATEAKQDIIDTNVDAILVDTGTTIPAQITALDGVLTVDTVKVNGVTVIGAGTSGNLWRA